jgi:hypothetical protein
LDEKENQKGRRKASSLTTKQLFDEAFKLIFKSASSPAVVRAINGLFEEKHDPESPVIYQSTENIFRIAGRMKRRTSDMVLTIDDDDYLIEAQIEDDELIALRVVEYEYLYALLSKKIEGNHIRLKIPKVRVLYWETTQKTYDTYYLDLEQDDGSIVSHAIKTFKVLEHSLTDLDRLNLVLLYPFYVLKVRKEARKKNISGERLQELADETEEIERNIVNLIKKAQADGRLTDSDAVLLQNILLDMHENLYSNYQSFEEVYMNVREVFKNTYEYLDWKQENEQAQQRLQAAEQSRRVAEQRLQAAEQSRRVAEQEAADLRRQLAAYQAAQSATRSTARPMA